MNLTFEGFLKGYCRELSGQQSLSFRKLVKQATTVAPRVAEPLFLLALAQGKAEYVLGLSEGSWMEQDYRDVLSLYGQAGSMASLCAKSELPNRYANVWRAYRAVKEKPAADRRVNALMRKKTLEALEESGVTRYGLCRALRLNKGNVTMATYPWSRSLERVRLLQFICPASTRRTRHLLQWSTSFSLFGEGGAASLPLRVCENMRERTRISVVFR